MRRPLIKGKDFHIFHWTRKTSSWKTYGKCGGEEFLSCVFFKKGRE
jgi:hypothetical protein